ncbi:hypothetical protein HYDPIDRAFT_107920 [Hydnomerulius pinastri MD-312]|nr:hypothetical protein HYDPIDRAFT_107920 [Hydnomerulius pinastri MD-312]
MDRDHNLPSNQGGESTGSQNPADRSVLPVIETGPPPPERIQIITPEGSGDSAAGGRPLTSSTADKPLLGGSEGFSTFPRAHDNPYTDFEPVPRITSPAPARSRDGHRGPSRRATVLSQGAHNASQAGIDWIVPVEEKGHSRRTVGERLQPTIENAIVERDKYAKKAMMTGYALNIAIGLQVLLGALTTGLSAAISGRQESGLATLVASYLARARGSNEPELSITRVKDLEQFLRDCRAFQMDRAHEYGTAENCLNQRLDDLRRRFEELLGNANGERKLSPV